jgi:hypothetical protein
VVRMAEFRPVTFCCLQMAQRLVRPLVRRSKCVSRRQSLTSPFIVHIFSVNIYSFFLRPHPPILEHVVIVVATCGLCFEAVNAMVAQVCAIRACCKYKSGVNNVCLGNEGREKSETEMVPEDF